MKEGRASRSRERGAAAVEFALVLPLLLLLVLGGIDWGYFFFCSEIAANAAREGARSAALARIRPVYPNPCVDDAGPPAAPGAEAIVRNYMMAGLLIANPMDGRLKPFTCTAGNGCCQLSTITVGGGTIDVVQVSVVYQTRPGSMSLTGFLPARLLPTAVVATATMRVEQ